MTISFSTNQRNYSRNIMQKAPTFAKIKRVRVKKNISDRFVPEMHKHITPGIEEYDYKIKKPVQYAMKRTFDYTVATMGIVLTSPIMLAAAVAIKLDSKGPVIFKQTRIGQYGKPFTIYKFRTMYVDGDNGHLGKIKDDPRVTRVGKFLRKHSIDELPQLFNILKGDMSIVSPRPIPEQVQQQLFMYKPEAVKRYLFKPGAMLNYNRETDQTAQSRFATENIYFKDWHFLRDVRHFLGTLKDVAIGNNF